MFLQILSQMPEIPKTNDVGAWFGWVVTVLGMLIVGALGFVIANGRKQESIAADSINRLISTLEESHQAAEARYKAVWESHTQGQSEISRTLGIISNNSDANHRIIVNELKEIREDLKKNGGRS